MASERVARECYGYGSWAAPYDVKVSRRKREFVATFREQPGAMAHGCSVIEDDGVPIALIYKIAQMSAVWIDG